MHDATGQRSRFIRRTLIGFIAGIPTFWLSALDKPDRLPEEVLRYIETPDNEVYFSAVSIWEIAIKTSLGRANFAYSPEQIAQAAQETGFIELPVTFGHAAKIAGLPLYHHDPFDRLLVVQTLLMPARLLT